LSGYARALALNPDQWDVYYQRGRTYASLGRYQQAVEDYTQALKRVPKDAYRPLYEGRLFESRAQCYVSLKAYARAADDFTQALNREPGTAQLYESRAHCYVFLKAYDQAAADLRRAAAPSR
jgi:tetratricopeptide (TPR) repeat protein